MRTLLAIMMLMLPSLGQAQSFSTVEIKGLMFRPISDSEAELYDSEAKGKVIVPMYVPINGKQYKVTVIGECAFYRKEWTNKHGDCNADLKQIQLPASIRVIKERAFQSCKYLTEIELPSSLQRIEDEAFDGCPINTVTIPDSVRWIGNNVFNCTKKITNLPLSLEHLGYTGNWGGGCYNFDHSVRIPASCKYIGMLPDIYLQWGIPNTIDTIEYVALNHLPYKTIVLPDNVVLQNTVRNVPKTLFKGCKNLEKVRGTTIPYPMGLFDVMDDIDPEIPYSKYCIKAKLGFSYYMYQKVPKKMEEWQQKGELETTTQWKKRMSAENRLAQLKEYIDQAKAEYIRKNKPTVSNYTLGKYDADNEIFPLYAGQTDTIYLKVNRGLAKTFKDNFQPQSVVAEYGIKNDEVCLLNCKYMGIYEGIQKGEDNLLNGLAFSIPAVNIGMYGNGQQNSSEKAKPKKPLDNSLDVNVPLSSAGNDRTFAVLIGNEKYQLVSTVPFAVNDMKAMAAYCEKTLGIPPKNILTYENASYGTMLRAIQNLKEIAQAYKDIKVIFYYAGHGIPNESTGDAFLLPVDADGKQVETCMATAKLYKELSELGAQTVVVLLDACFSGAVRGEGMLVAARGVAIKAKQPEPIGNMVVMSAATGEQTAYPYAEKGHGMFTYFFLKKLQETKGNVTLGELADYVKTQVSQQSILINGKSQTPAIHTTRAFMDNWKSENLNTK